MSAFVVLSCEQQIDDDGSCTARYRAEVADVDAARAHASLKGWTYDGTIDRCPICAQARPRPTLATTAL
ncbi:hypothetical protein [Nonomuraea sp. NPDC049646]|uniref:hypothetical protein n=1 Tax=unclassified Nonomuraea TaxID=2593643 RepID=UPI003795BD08